MLKMFFELMASGLGGASVLVFLGGTLKVITGWNLRISISHSVIELPGDMVSVLALTGLLATLAATFWSMANVRRVWEGLKARPLVALTALVGVAASLYGAYFLMMGGTLGTAFERNDVATVIKSLDSSKVPQERLNGYLYQALRNERLDMARALADHGADVNRIAGEHSSSLLSDACVFFPKSSVLMLLERGAKPDLQDKFGRSAAQCMLLYRPSHQAVEGEAGMIEILEQLARRGADLKQPASNGDTALSVAREKKLAQVEAWLVGQEKSAK